MTLVEQQHKLEPRDTKVRDFLSSLNLRAEPEASGANTSLDTARQMDEGGTYCNTLQCWHKILRNKVTQKKRHEQL